MARGFGPTARDLLIDFIILILQLATDAWQWLASVRLGRGDTAKRGGSGQTRGSRPARPTTIGLVFAEPCPEDVSLQQAANLIAWCGHASICARARFALPLHPLRCAVTRLMQHAAHSQHTFNPSPLACTTNGITT